MDLNNKFTKNFLGVSRFSIMHMIRVAMSTQDTPDLNSSQNSARLVAPPPSALFQPGNIQPPQALNAQNPDYAERKNYHHTEQLGAAKQQHP